jgi:RNA polymerase sigma-70 factor, ECF subfamily
MDWAAIVRTHGPQATRTAYRILGHAVDTEDAVQAAFMDAVRVARKGGVGNWGALMGHLATCRALDLLRRRHGKSGESLNGRDLPAMPESHPEAVAVARERATILRQALAALPEREAQVFSLKYFGDLSNPEIAGMLDIEVGAVGVALHKARGRLREMMQKDDE